MVKFKMSFFKLVITSYALSFKVKEKLKVTAVFYLRIAIWNGGLKPLNYELFLGLS